MIINDEKELIFLIGLLGKSGMPVDNTQQDWSGAYIGATDEGMPGFWRWVDGKPLTYAQWKPGEPTGRAQHCTQLLFHYGGQWDDVEGVGPRPYICEWNE